MGWVRDQGWPGSAHDTASLVGSAHRSHRTPAQAAV